MIVVMSKSQKTSSEFVLLLDQFWGKITLLLYSVTIYSRNSHQSTALGYHWNKPKEENKDTITQNTGIVWWALDDEDSDHRDQENYQREENYSSYHWTMNMKSSTFVEDREA